ncbi:PTS sugar transporter subunit IIB [Priestia megaterium]|uniref:PTS sugar transporter subunit IIB n=1 Tax=Priestia megaterium TaxID=1404 RepID=UPI002E23AF39|nr:PTS sugar transporter subunit IIB [Priestia megaterium]
MKILVVCGNGLGSSLITEMNVKKALVNMGIEAQVGHTDLATSKTENADYYLGAPEIVENLNDGSRKIISVRNIFSLPEIESALKEHL